MDSGDRGTAIGGVILAAGAGLRFGSPKQLATFDGRPLLEHALLAMAAATRVERTVVVLGADTDEILARVERHGALPVIATGWEEGQSASLRSGTAALAGLVDAVVVTLGDQPWIEPAAIDRVVAARNSSAVAVRASYGDRPGHPVLLERDLLVAAADLRGDAQPVLERGRVARGVRRAWKRRDIDTPEQLRLSAGESRSPL
jgi:molybdenum cofactor cytidylyltransferase